MTDIEDQATLRLARAIVVSERGEELPLFDAQAPALLKRVREGERASSSSDAFLGIGDESATIALITPVALVLAEATIALLKDAARGAASDFLKQVILGWLSWLAGRSKRPPEGELPERLKSRLRDALRREMEIRFPAAKTNELVETVLRRTFEGVADDDARK